jgi:hypothetical protein
MRIVSKFSLLLTILVLPIHASAQTSEEQFEQIQVISSPISLLPGETKTLSLDRWRYVQKLSISAAGRRDEAMFEVIVNDDVKGTIHVPGRDPDYIVTVAETTRSVQLRHLSGGTVAISALTATVSNREFPDHGGTGPMDEHSRGLAADVSYRVIQNIKALEISTSTPDIQRYLIPVKSAAGRAYASATASGDLSRRVRDRLIVLLAQMDSANPLIDRALENEESFDAAVDFLSLKESLSDLLD